MKKIVDELKDGLMKLGNPSYNNIDKLMQSIMKKYDLTAKELHYGFRDLNDDKTPDEWIKGKKKMKTFREFLEYSSSSCKILSENRGDRTFLSKEEAAAAFKKNPPFGGEPYRIKQKARKGNPREWRAIRSGPRQEQERRRSANLKGLRYQEILDYAKRNLLPNPEKLAKQAHRNEINAKRSQTTEARKRTIETGVEQTIDHTVPQQDRRSPENRKRFQAVAPGDTSTNRSVMAKSTNSQLGSKLPERGTPGARLTRSGAVRNAINSVKIFKEFYDYCLTIRSSNFKSS